MSVNTRIQIRRGSASLWTSTNPTLYAGEIGYETDTGRIKIGDGTTQWTSLDYNFVVPTGFIGGSGINITPAADGSSVSISLSDPVINIGDITGFDDAVNDRVSDLLTAGSNIQLTYTDENDDTSTLAIAVTGVSLSGHTHSLSEITDVTASFTEVNYLDGSNPGTVTSGNAVVVDNNKNITGFNNITATGTISANTIATTGNITVGGDLVVHGTTTTVNSTTVDIGDNIIRVNTSGLSTGGFEVFDGSGYQSIIWDNVSERWELTGSEVYSTGVLVGSQLESTVVGPAAPLVVVSTGLVNNLNSDLLDGQHGSYYLNYVNISGTPVIGNGTLSLGVNGTGLSGSASFGANDTGNTTFTVTSNATPANTANAIISRDASGNFVATNITASGFIGDGSQLTNLNASNLSTGTVSSGLLPTLVATTGTAGPASTFVSAISTDNKGRIISVNNTTHILATTGIKGIASFNNEDFSVSDGVVSIKTSGVANSQLENDSLTIGQTELLLGSTYSAISGISSASPVVLTYFAIDGGSP